MACFRRSSKVCLLFLDHTGLKNVKYFNKVNDVSEDIWFWKQVRQRTDYKIVIDPQIQVGHIAQVPINYGIFKGFYEANKEKVKASMNEKEFDKFWSEICRPTLVK